MNSWTRAIEAGFDPGRYEGHDVPEGAWVGRLDFKVWTKTGMGVSCYFTREDDAREGGRPGASEGVRDRGAGGASEGASVDAPVDAPERYRLAAFRERDRSGRSGPRYVARDGAVDFADDVAAPGDRFLVTVGRSRNGAVRWVAAEPLAGSGEAAGRAAGGTPGGAAS